jgi:hypothetical protein
MHQSLEDLSPEDRRTYRIWTRGIFAFYGALLAGLVVIAMSTTPAAQWVSDAANAEFVGTDLTPPMAPLPTQQAARID